MGKSKTIIIPKIERKNPNKKPSTDSLPFCFATYRPNKPIRTAGIKIIKSDGNPIMIKFEDLNIISGTTQFFELTNQVTGDLSDINILVDIDCIVQGPITLSTQLDFSNGSAYIRIIDSNYDTDISMNCEDATIY